MPPGVYLMPDETDPLRTSSSLSYTRALRDRLCTTRSLLSRRLSLQRTVYGSKYPACPSYHFFPTHPDPPNCRGTPLILLTQAASGRVNMLPYLSMAMQRAWSTHPEEPMFLTCLAHYLHELFSADFCATLKDQWILNENMGEYVGLLLTFETFPQRPHSI